jgi:hypothetical protein
MHTEAFIKAHIPHKTKEIFSAGTNQCFDVTGAEFTSPDENFANIFDATQTYYCGSPASIMHPGTKCVIPPL